MNHNQQIGKFGESLAKDYLLKHGYKIIAENVKISYHEIDIISYIKGIYVFIEVKTRTNSTFGFAEEAISAKKINNLKKAISHYLYQKKLSTANVRLDFISIDINSEKMAKIKHFKNIT
jgi:putative endonuclease